MWWGSSWRRPRGERAETLLIVMRKRPRSRGRCIVEIEEVDSAAGGMEGGETVVVIGRGVLVSNTDVHLTNRI